MAKLATSFELALAPNRAKLAAYRWLYESLRTEILEGRLRPGRRLPSTRDLASQYSLARGTIMNAFDQLKAEGYLRGTTGSGTYVNEVLPENLLHVVGPTPIPSKPRRTLPRLSAYARRAQLFRGYEIRPMRAFRANLPALDLFPTELWTRITLRCLRRASTRHLMGCDPLGYLPLRKVLAEYLTHSRGVRCAPEQLAIVSGVQEAVDLTGRLLLDPGDHVCVENPGYPGAVFAFQAFGAKLVSMPIDSEGLTVHAIPKRGVRLAYVTPGHQFPLGTTMSLSRRLEFLQWARRSDAWILEDDYDSEFRYSGKPIPALQGLDEHGRVFYAGSFSKVLFPSLRLGYIVVPQSLLERFEAIQSITVRHAPVLEQFVLTEFIADGHFSRHLRRMRKIYSERLGILLEESRRHLEGLLDISPIEAGLQTIGWLRAGINADAAARAAAHNQVDVTPLSSYRTGKPIPEGLQLGFAAIDPKEIRRGVRDLATALSTKS